MTARTAPEPPSRVFARCSFKLSQAPVNTRVYVPCGCGVEFDVDEQWWSGDSDVPGYGLWVARPDPAVVEP